MLLNRSTKFFGKIGPRSFYFAFVIYFPTLCCSPWYRRSIIPLAITEYRRVLFNRDNLITTHILLKIVSVFGSKKTLSLDGFFIFWIFNRTLAVAFATPDKFESKHKQSKKPNKCQRKLNIARTPLIPTFSCVRSHQMTQKVTSCQQTNRFFQTKLLRVSSKSCLHSAASSRVQLTKMHCMFVVGQCSLDTYLQCFVEFASESIELMKRAYFLSNKSKFCFSLFV